MLDENIIADAELIEAEHTIRAIPEYRWLWNSQQQWYTVSEVVKKTDFTASAIRNWCDQGKIRNAQYFGQQAGWRIPRSGLIFFFAEVMQESKRRRATGGEE